MARQRQRGSFCVIIVAKVVKQCTWWFVDDVDDVADVDDIGVVGDVGEVVDNDGEDGRSASLKMRIFTMVLPALCS